MPKRLSTLILSCLLMTAAASPHAAADASDTLRYIEKGDPDMAKALAKAQAGLDDFLATFDNPPAGTENYSVKIGIVDQGDGFALTGLKSVDNVEYFWIGNLKRTDDGFSGTLANEPGVVRNIRAGQEITFAKGDIFDWMYIRDRKIVGNVTSCPILLRGPAEELQYYRDTLGLEC